MHINGKIIIDQFRRGCKCLGDCVAFFVVKYCLIYYDSTRIWPFIIAYNMVRVNIKIAPCMGSKMSIFWRQLEWRNSMAWPIYIIIAINADCVYESFPYILTFVLVFDMRINYVFVFTVIPWKFFSFTFCRICHRCRCSKYSLNKNRNNKSRCALNVPVTVVSVFVTFSLSLSSLLPLSLPIFPCPSLPLYISLNSLRPRQMDAISQTFSNAFSWMKIFEFRLKFHWSLFLRVQLTISQHWFR